MSAHTSVSEIRVRYSETDQMGIAYHTHYLVWCEVGRTDYIRSIGTAYADLERQGVLLAVAEASVRYSASARYDDRIRIVTRVSRVQSRAITFAYDLTRVDEDSEVPVATAETRLIAIDRSGATRKLPATLTEALRDAMEESPA